MPQCTGPVSKYAHIFEQGKSSDKGPKARGGGYQMTYTGVGQVDPKTQLETTNRLSSHNGNIADSRRVIPDDVKHTAGNVHSYQWKAGGNQSHGFMW